LESRFLEKGDLITHCYALTRSPIETRSPAMRPGDARAILEVTITT